MVHSLVGIMNRLFFHSDIKTAKHLEQDKFNFAKMGRPTTHLKFCQCGLLVILSYQNVLAKRWIIRCKKLIYYNERQMIHELIPNIIRVPFW
jgi:hypothetical protein